MPLQPELDEEVEPVLKKKAMFSNLLERVGKDDRLDGDDAFVRVGRARWITIDENDERFQKMYANHQQLVIKAARAIEREAERVELLATAVKWGEIDWVKRVLDAPSLYTERSPDALQKALQVAMLEGAAPSSSSGPAFDATIAHLLIERGARQADVYWSGLFADAADRASCSDVFGLFRRAGKRRC